MEATQEITGVTQLSESERELFSALVEAREIARAGGAGGFPEVHTTPDEKHCASRNCWCSPEVHYVDPDTNVVVYQHREVQ